jgi:hypothetical protein
MDISEVRRRLRRAIEEARREEAGRRARVDTAARDYEVFLPQVAVPIFRQAASALAAEGHRFTVFTPAESVRLASERSTGDYLELALDSSQDPPRVIGRSSRGRGRRMVTAERPLREGATVAELTDEDVLQFLLTDIVPLLQR